MKRLLAATALVAMCCLAQPADNVWANQGFPPKNLPPGSGWLPGPNATVAVSPFQLRAFERPKAYRGPFGRYTPPSGGNRSDATPIQLPAPRSVGSWPRASVKTIERPNTLPRTSQLRLPPRPLATPIQLP